MKVTLKTKTYPEEGDFQHAYSPLRNLVDLDGNLKDFTISRDKLPINVNNPVSIECQSSYDGTVNLIISDDDNPIRLVNSRFTKTENNRFKIINRDQIDQTNIYKENDISSVDLILKPKIFPKVKFKQLRSCGSLMGGNYTFYVKYVDGDGNESDYVAETFQIPVFKGTVGYPKTISGTLMDERTDKAIVLYFTDLDSSFQKIKLYFSRETSDLNGYRISKAGEILETFDIIGNSMEVLITGNEEINEINIDVINTERFTFTSAKTQCQQQNMLFLGNITKSQYDIVKLRNVSLFFQVSWKQDENVGWIDPKDYSTNDSGEYYSPENVCYKTGYWPDEFYRLGVVYVLEDGTHTDVFNLRGCCFSNDYRTNISSDDKYIINGIKQNLPTKTFLDKTLWCRNTYGVFRNPGFDDINPIIDYSKKKVIPLHYEISLTDEDAIQELKNCGVKYCFFVRQKRIPTILFQGFSLDVDKNSGSPMIKDEFGSYTESFLTNRASPMNRELGLITSPEETLSAAKAYSYTNTTNGSALISPDVSFIPDLQTTLCGSKMQIEKISETCIPELNKRNHIFYPNKKEYSKNYNFDTIFVNEDIPYKIVNNFQFSTRFGSPESVKEKSFFGKEPIYVENDRNTIKNAYHKENYALLRGIYTSFVGVCGKLETQCLYNIRAGNFNSAQSSLYIKERGFNHSPFFSISDKFDISNGIDTTSIWGGDCYSNTVTIRLTRNFIDPDAPINDYILDPSGWKNNYRGHMNMVESKNSEEASKHTDTSKGDWYKINRGDVNSSAIGMWITFKLLSSYNLGLRSEDRTHVQEMAMMGNPRSFYPLSGMSISSNAKISESKSLNMGYSATVSAKEYYEHPDIPYVKTLFDNRIVYSNIQVEDEFKNGYRVFSPLAYKDVDRQYGAIVKLLPWGSNLICVFEHGIALIPVNEKALIQSTSGQSIHMYGAGVLSGGISLISGDFGSIWQDSIIKTNIGIYGVDTYAKKIWRYSEQNGFETLSDMKIQRFLNDNIILSESDKYPNLALKNVKTHYNAYKGDVMFTFYNYREGKEWNICFNERIGKWITRYSWIPINSDNINNCYFSLDKKRAELLGHIHSLEEGPFIIEPKEDGRSGYFWDDDELSSISMNLKINEDFGNESFNINILAGETSYLNKSNKEIRVVIHPQIINTFCKYYSNNGTSGTLIINKNNYEKWWESLFPQWIETGEKIITTEDNEDDYDDYDSSIDENQNDINSEYESKAMPLYLKIYVEVLGHNKGVDTKPVYKTIVILPDSDKIEHRRQEYDELLVNGFYVHGRAGIFDEMNYQDDDPENQIQPTKWYDKQEPFEFEFVVNSPVGLHKIFDNLVIISNNVQPNSIEYTIEGDTYSLFKNNDLFNNNKKRQLYLSGVGFKNAKLNYDTILNQYSLTIHQDCKNIADPKYGRRLGNIQYKEDSWYATIEPLVFDPLLKASPEDQKAKWTSTRIRDKFLKVRVKYTGEDLVIITAIKNLCTLSRA